MNSLYKVDWLKSVPWELEKHKADSGAEGAGITCTKEWSHLFTKRKRKLVTTVQCNFKNFIGFSYSRIVRIIKIKKLQGIQCGSLISTVGLLPNWFKFWNILDWQLLLTISTQTVLHHINRITGLKNTKSIITVKNF